MTQPHYTRPSADSLRDFAKRCRNRATELSNEITELKDRAQKLRLASKAFQARNLEQLKAKKEQQRERSLLSARSSEAKADLLDGVEFEKLKEAAL